MSPDTVSDDLDPRAPIVDGETFTLVAELQLRQAIRLQYYVSLLVIQVDTNDPGLSADLVALYRVVADVIRGQVRGTDVIGVTPAPPYLLVLLVSTHLYNIPTVIERIAAAVNHPGRVTLSMGAACFPTTAHGWAELFRQAETLSAEARREPIDQGHRYRLAQAAP